MNSLIKKIKISGFRSIYNEELICSEINVFSGLNDSGKSNVLRALNLFFNYFTDFQTNLKFQDDYNKVSLARAQRSAKGKQQIKIRVYFKPPKNYKSLLEEDQIWLERAFDRYGKISEKYSNESKRAQISRLVNRIKYVFIPALKGPNVLSYILGLIGEYELIESRDVKNLNEKISGKTEDLREILQKSEVSLHTTFGLPALLNDFWGKLSVKTEFDKFKTIDQKIKGKGDNQPLNASQYSISLLSRGEGIKSKFIPPLLQWLATRKKGDIYIWGIDEPENSLEFKLSQEQANLYYNEYSKKNQIFITSHSLAFLNPTEENKITPTLYRALKDEFGSTYFKTFSELFKEQEKFDFFEEIGVLEVQKEVIKRYRELNQENTNLKISKDRLDQIEEPVILTEGKTDKYIIEKAWEKLYPDQPIPFRVEPSGHHINADKRTGSAKQVQHSLQYLSNVAQQTIIGLFDNDWEGNSQFKGLKKEAFEEYDQTKIKRKHKENNVYGLLLPTPDFREQYTQSTSLRHKYLEIEHYFEDEIINRYNLKGIKYLAPIFLKSLQTKQKQISLTKQLIV